MTDKEKILAEIERRWKYDQGFSTDEETRAYQQCCDDISSFINSLPEEPVSKALDVAAKESVSRATPYTIVNIGNGELPVYTSHVVVDRFKAGAQWQKERDIEKNCIDYRKHDDV